MVTDYFSEKATGTDKYFESIFKVVVVYFYTFQIRLNN